MICAGVTTCMRLDCPTQQRKQSPYHRSIALAPDAQRPQNSNTSDNTTNNCETRPPRLHSRAATVACWSGAREEGERAFCTLLPESVLLRLDRQEDGLNTIGCTIYTVRIVSAPLTASCAVAASWALSHARLQHVQPIDGLPDEIIDSLTTDGLLHFAIKSNFE